MSIPQHTTSILLDQPRPISNPDLDNTNNHSVSIHIDNSPNNNDMNGKPPKPHNNNDITNLLNPTSTHVPNHKTFADNNSYYTHNINHCCDNIGLCSDHDIASNQASAENPFTNDQSTSKYHTVNNTIQFPFTSNIFETHLNDTSDNTTATSYPTQVTNSNITRPQLVQSTNSVLKQWLYRYVPVDQVEELITKPNELRQFLIKSLSASDYAKSLHFSSDYTLQVVDILIAEMYQNQIDENNMITSIIDQDKANENHHLDQNNASFPSPPAETITKTSPNSSEISNSPTNSLEKPTNDKKAQKSPFPWSEIIFYTIYTILIAGCSLLYILKMYYSPYYAVLSGWILGAKAMAGVIYANLALVFLPTCHTLISYLQSHQTLRRFIPLNRIFFLHKLCAWSMVVAGCIHTICHLGGSFRILRNIDCATTPAPYCGYSYLGFIFLSIPGSTGVLLLICFGAIAFTSRKSFRTKHFSTFFTVHHLFIAIAILLCVHGTGKFVQTPHAWRYLLFGFTLYIIDRFLRAFFTQKKHNFVIKRAKVIDFYLPEGSIDDAIQGFNHDLSKLRDAIDDMDKDDYNQDHFSSIQQQNIDPNNTKPHQNGLNINNDNDTPNIIDFNTSDVIRGSTIDGYYYDSDQQAWVHADYDNIHNAHNNDHDTNNQYFNSKDLSNTPYNHNTSQLMILTQLSSVGDNNLINCTNYSVDPIIHNQAKNDTSSIHFPKNPSVGQKNSQNMQIIYPNNHNPTLLSLNNFAKNSNLLTPNHSVVVLPTISRLRSIIPQSPTSGLQLETVYFPDIDLKPTYSLLDHDVGGETDKLNNINEIIDKNKNDKNDQADKDNNIHHNQDTNEQSHHAENQQTINFQSQFRPQPPQRSSKTSIQITSSTSSITTTTNNNNDGNKINDQKTQQKKPLYDHGNNNDNGTSNRRTSDNSTFNIDNFDLQNDIVTRFSSSYSTSDLIKLTPKEASVDALQRAGIRNNGIKHKKNAQNVLVNDDHDENNERIIQNDKNHQSRSSITKVPIYSPKPQCATYHQGDGCNNVINYNVLDQYLNHNNHHNSNVSNNNTVKQIDTQGGNSPNCNNNSTDSDNNNYPQSPSRIRYFLQTQPQTLHNNNSHDNSTSGSWSQYISAIGQYIPFLSRFSPFSTPQDQTMISNNQLSSPKSIDHIPTPQRNGHTSQIYHGNGPFIQGGQYNDQNYVFVNGQIIAQNDPSLQNQTFTILPPPSPVSKVTTTTLDIANNLIDMTHPSSYGYNHSLYQYGSQYHIDLHKENVEIDTKVAKNINNNVKNGNNNNFSHVNQYDGNAGIDIQQNCNNYQHTPELSLKPSNKTNSFNSHPTQHFNNNNSHNSSHLQQHKCSPSCSLSSQPASNTIPVSISPYHPNTYPLLQPPQYTQEDLNAYVQKTLDEKKFIFGKFESFIILELIPQDNSILITDTDGNEVDYETFKKIAMKKGKEERRQKWMVKKNEKKEKKEKKIAKNANAMKIQSNGNNSVREKSQSFDSNGQFYDLDVDIDNSEDEFIIDEDDFDTKFYKIKNNVDQNADKMAHNFNQTNIPIKKSNLKSNINDNINDEDDLTSDSDSDTSNNDSTDYDSDVSDYDDLDNNNLINQKRTNLQKFQNLTSHLKRRNKKKSPYKYRSGQYLKITIPELSHVSHPFTIAGSPTIDDNVLVVMIKVVGSFTQGLREKILAELATNKFISMVEQQQRQHQLYLDRQLMECVNSKVCTGQCDGERVNDVQQSNSSDNNNNNTRQRKHNNGFNNPNKGVKDITYQAMLSRFSTMDTDFDTNYNQNNKNIANYIQFYQNNHNNNYQENILHQNNDTIGYNNTLQSSNNSIESIILDNGTRFGTKHKISTTNFNSFGQPSPYLNPNRYSTSTCGSFDINDIMLPPGLIPLDDQNNKNHGKNHQDHIKYYHSPHHNHNCIKNCSPNYTCSYQSDRSDIYSYNTSPTDLMYPFLIKNLVQNDDNQNIGQRNIHNQHILNLDQNYTSGDNDQIVIKSVNLASPWLYFPVTITASITNALGAPTTSIQSIMKRSPEYGDDFDENFGQNGDNNWTQKYQNNKSRKNDEKNNLGNNNNNTIINGPYNDQVKISIRKHVLVDNDDEYGESDANNTNIPRSITTNIDINATNPIDVLTKLNLHELAWGNEEDFKNEIEKEQINSKSSSSDIVSTNKSPKSSQRRSNINSKSKGSKRFHKNTRNRSRSHHSTTPPRPKHPSHLPFTQLLAVAGGIGITPFYSNLTFLSHALHVVNTNSQYSTDNINLSIPYHRPFGRNTSSSLRNDVLKIKLQKLQKIANKKHPQMTKQIAKNIKRIKLTIKTKNPKLYQNLKSFKNHIFPSKLTSINLHTSELPYCGFQSRLVHLTGSVLHPILQNHNKTKMSTYITKLIKHRDSMINITNNHINHNVNIDITSDSNSNPVSNQLPSPLQDHSNIDTARYNSPNTTLSPQSIGNHHLNNEEATITLLDPPNQFNISNFDHLNKQTYHFQLLLSLMYPEQFALHSSSSKYYTGQYLNPLFGQENNTNANNKNHRTGSSLINNDTKEEVSIHNDGLETNSSSVNYNFKTLQSQKVNQHTTNIHQTKNNTITTNDSYKVRQSIGILEHLAATINQRKTQTSLHQLAYASKASNGFSSTSQHHLLYGLGDDVTGNNIKNSNIVKLSSFNLEPSQKNENFTAQNLNLFNQNSNNRNNSNPIENIASLHDFGPRRPESQHFIEFMPLKRNTVIKLQGDINEIGTIPINNDTFDIKTDETDPCAYNGLSPNVVDHNNNNNKNYLDESQNHRLSITNSINDSAKSHTDSIQSHNTDRTVVSLPNVSIKSIQISDPNSQQSIISNPNFQISTNSGISKQNYQISTNSSQKTTISYNRSSIPITIATLNSFISAAGQQIGVRVDGVQYTGRNSIVNFDQNLENFIKNEQNNNKIDANYENDENHTHKKQILNKILTDSMSIGPHSIGQRTHFSNQPIFTLQSMSGHQQDYTFYQNNQNHDYDNTQLIIENDSNFHHPTLQRDSFNINKKKKQLSSTEIAVPYGGIMMFGLSDDKNNTTNNTDENGVDNLNNRPCDPNNDDTDEENTTFPDVTIITTDFIPTTNTTPIIIFNPTQTPTTHHNIEYDGLYCDRLTQKIGRFGTNYHKYNEIFNQKFKKLQKLKQQQQQQQNQHNNIEIFSSTANPTHKRKNYESTHILVKSAIAPAVIQPSFVPSQLSSLFPIKSLLKLSHDNSNTSHTRYVNSADNVTNNCINAINNAVSIPSQIPPPHLRSSHHRYHPDIDKYNHNYSKSNKDTSNVNGQDYDTDQHDSNHEHYQSVQTSMTSLTINPSANPSIVPTDSLFSIQQYGLQSIDTASVVSTMGDNGANYEHVDLNDQVEDEINKYNGAEHGLNYNHNKSHRTSSSGSMIAMDLNDIDHGLYVKSVNNDTNDDQNTTTQTDHINISTHKRNPIDVTKRYHSLSNSGYSNLKNNNTILESRKHNSVNNFFQDQNYKNTSNTFDFDPYIPSSQDVYAMGLAQNHQRHSQNSLHRQKRINSTTHGVDFHSQNTKLLKNGRRNQNINPTTNATKSINTTNNDNQPIDDVDNGVDFLDFSRLCDEANGFCGIIPKDQRVKWKMALQEDSDNSNQDISEANNIDLCIEHNNHTNHVGALLLDQQTTNKLVDIKQLDVFDKNNANNQSSSQNPLASILLLDHIDDAKIPIFSLNTNRLINNMINFSYTNVDNFTPQIITTINLTQYNEPNDHIDITRSPKNSDHKHNNNGDNIEHHQIIKQQHDHDISEYTDSELALSMNSYSYSLYHHSGRSLPVNLFVPNQEKDTNIAANAINESFSHMNPDQDYNNNNERDTTIQLDEANVNQETTLYDKDRINVKTPHKNINSAVIAQTPITKRHSQAAIVPFTPSNAYKNHHSNKNDRFYLLYQQDVQDNDILPSNLLYHDNTNLAREENDDFGNTTNNSIKEKKVKNNNIDRFNGVGDHLNRLTAGINTFIASNLYVHEGFSQNDVCDGENDYTNSVDKNSPLKNDTMTTLPLGYKRRLSNVPVQYSLKIDTDGNCEVIREVIDLGEEVPEQFNIEQNIETKNSNFNFEKDQTLNNVADNSDERLHYSNFRGSSSSFYSAVEAPTPISSSLLYGDDVTYTNTYENINTNGQNNKHPTTSNKSNSSYNTPPPNNSYLNQYQTGQMYSNSPNNTYNDENINAGNGIHIYQDEKHNHHPNNLHKNRGTRQMYISSMTQTRTPITADVSTVLPLLLPYILSLSQRQQLDDYLIHSIVHSLMGSVGEDDNNFKNLNNYHYSTQNTHSIIPTSLPHHNNHNHQTVSPPQSSLCPNTSHHRNLAILMNNLFTRSKSTVFDHYLHNLNISKQIHLQRKLNLSSLTQYFTHSLTSVLPLPITFPLSTPIVHANTKLDIVWGVRNINQLTLVHYIFNIMTIASWLSLQHIQYNNVMSLYEGVVDVINTTGIFDKLHNTLTTNDHDTDSNLHYDDNNIYNNQNDKKYNYCRHSSHHTNHHCDQNNNTCCLNNNTNSDSSTSLTPSSSNCSSYFSHHISENSFGNNYTTSSLDSTNNTGHNCYKSGTSLIKDDKDVQNNNDTNKPAYKKLSSNAYNTSSTHNTVYDFNNNVNSNHSESRNYHHDSHNNNHNALNTKSNNIDNTNNTNIPPNRMSLVTINDHQYHIDTTILSRLPTSLQWLSPFITKFHLRITICITDQNITNLAKNPMLVLKTLFPSYNNVLYHQKINIERLWCQIMQNNASDATFDAINDKSNNAVKLYHAKINQKMSKLKNTHNDASFGGVENVNTNDANIKTFSYDHYSPTLIRSTLDSLLSQYENVRDEMSLIDSISTHKNTNNNKVQHQNNLNRSTDTSNTSNQINIAKYISLYNFVSSLSLTFPWLDPVSLLLLHGQYRLQLLHEKCYVNSNGVLDITPANNNTPTSLTTPTTSIHLPHRTPIGHQYHSLLSKLYVTTPTPPQHYPPSHSPINNPTVTPQQCDDQALKSNYPITNISNLEALPPYGTWYMRFGRPTQSLLRQLMVESGTNNIIKHGFGHINDENHNDDTNEAKNNDENNYSASTSNTTNQRTTTKLDIDLSSSQHVRIRTYCCCPTPLEQLTIDVTNELNMASVSQSYNINAVIDKNDSDIDHIPHNVTAGLDNSKHCKNDDITTTEQCSIHLNVKETTVFHTENESEVF